MEKNMAIGTQHDKTEIVSFVIFCGIQGQFLQAEPFSSFFQYISDLFFIEYDLFRTAVHVQCCLGTFSNHVVFTSFGYLDFRSISASLLYLTSIETVKKNGKLCYNK